MMEEYKNILCDFKNESNDYQWISRPIDFQETYKQERPKLSPTDYKLLVYNSHHMKNIIKKVYKETLNENDKNKIINIISEIGFDYDLSVVRWLGYILLKILRKSLSGLLINEEKLKKLKNDMGSSPVVFVPTHRSYADFILMAFVCFNYNINIPCVAAGMDFLSMKFMNKILRKSKAFFMRRKFSNDPLYRTIFKEYIKVLISFQNSPVEFFIEGTRSRSGKSLMPKFGFLTMLVDAFISCDIPDIKIIPVNISYERILEDSLFAHELIGIPKPKESTVGLLKGLRVMSGNYGKIFITFGDPITIRDFLLGADDYRFMLNEYENIKIKEIAYKILKEQMNLQIFGSINLLALIMNSTYMKKGSHQLTLNDAVEQFKWLLHLFKQFGATVYFEGSIENSIKDTIRVHDTFIKISTENYIYLKTIEKQSHSAKSSASVEYLMSYIPHVMLQIYINPTLNLFVRESIVVLILNRLNDKYMATKETLFENYQYICHLLKYEFVQGDVNIMVFNKCISKLKELHQLDISSSFVQLEQNVITNFLTELIHPFLSGIYLICSYLKNFQDQICLKSQQDIKKMIQSYIEGQIREGLFPYHYCSTVDFISNTLNSIFDIGVILQNEKENKYMFDGSSLNFAVEYLGWLTSQDHDGYLSQQKLINQVNKGVRAKL